MNNYWYIFLEEKGTKDVIQEPKECHERVVFSELVAFMVTKYQYQQTEAKQSSQYEAYWTKDTVQQVQHFADLTIYQIH